jgi:hypothetical protein
LPLMTESTVIPESERYRKLKEIVLEQVEKVSEIRKDKPQEVQRQLSFRFLVFPWAVEAGLPNENQKLVMDGQKAQIREWGFDGERAKKQLDEIHANDKHLAECCPFVSDLANYLDAYFITPAADAMVRGFSREQIETAFAEFESVTYHQGRFRRIALSHLYNFNMEGNSAQIVGANTEHGTIRIERLDANTIPAILGEPGFRAFLHPPNVGECFVVEEEGASKQLNDYEWLGKKYEKALAFAAVLQYFKDGVVHIGYSVPVFKPDWANQIRRTGLFFIGTPRQLPYEHGNKFYSVSTTEIQQLGRWWNLATTPQVLKALANKTGSLRQAIYRAADYYEASHRRLDVVERLITLAIALEALFSPSDGELSFRISQSAAQFIGKDAPERKAIFKDLREMYGRRSEIVHGTYSLNDYEQGTLVTAEEVDRWASYVRRALVGFLALYLKAPGNTKREAVLARIAEANFNDAAGEALRAEADAETLLASG